MFSICDINFISLNHYCINLKIPIIIFSLVSIVKKIHKRSTKKEFYWSRISFTFCNGQSQSQTSAAVSVKKNMKRPQKISSGGDPALRALALSFRKNLFANLYITWDFPFLARLSRNLFGRLKISTFIEFMYNCTGSTRSWLFYAIHYTGRSLSPCVIFIPNFVVV